MGDGGTGADGKINRKRTERIRVRKTHAMAVKMKTGHKKEKVPYARVNRREEKLHE